MCGYVCIYVNLRLRVYECVGLFPSVSVFLRFMCRVGVDISEFMCVCVFVSMSVWVSFRLSLCFSVLCVMCGYVCIYVCLRLRVHDCMGLFPSVSVFLRCMCLVGVDISVFMCVCVVVSMSVWVSFSPSLCFSVLCVCLSVHLCAVMRGYI